MRGYGVRATMIAGHLAGLHCFHLLGRHQGFLFLLGLLMDLANPLLPLLGSERSIGANGLDFCARPPADGGALFHGCLGDASFLPARRLMRLRRTHHRARMHWYGLLNTDGISLRGCQLT
jgi:hypothetical protein